MRAARGDLLRRARRFALSRTHGEQTLAHGCHLSLATLRGVADARRTQLSGQCGNVGVADRKTSRAERAACIRPRAENGC
jgi:hypothetical protein